MDVSTLKLACRFTDRTLEVKPHGHGVKLTIQTPDLSDNGCEIIRTCSVFLDQDNMEALARELASFDAPLQASADRSTALETVELALWELGHALEAAREKIAGIL